MQQQERRAVRRRGAGFQHVQVETVYARHDAGASSFRQQVGVERAFCRHAVLKKRSLSLQLRKLTVKCKYRKKAYARGEKSPTLLSRNDD